MGPGDGKPSPMGYMQTLVSTNKIITEIQPPSFTMCNFTEKIFCGDGYLSENS